MKALPSAGVWMDGNNWMWKCVFAKWPGEDLLLYTVMWAAGSWSELYILAGQSIMSLTANLAACPSWGSDAVGGLAKSWIRKLSFVKFECLSYCWMISLLNLLLTRVLCMPFRQSIQVLIWSWKARWHLHLHLHSDCDAAEMGTLHAPPCPLTCLAGGVQGIIRVGGLLPWLPSLKQ